MSPKQAALVSKKKLHFVDVESEAIDDWRAARSVSVCAVDI